MNPEELQFWLGQNFKVLISFIGAIQGFILAAIVLFYPLEHKTSNRLLSGFIFLQAYLLIATRIVDWVPAEVAWVVYSVRLLVYIFLYLYIKSLYTQINWKKEWYHLPILLIDILRIKEIALFKVSKAIETDGYVYQFFGSTLEILSIIWLFGTMIFYFSLTFRTVQKYRVKAEENFSDLNSVGMKWAKQIFYGKFALAITDYLLIFVAITFLDWYKPYQGILNALVYTGFMYFISIKGKLNPKIYQLRMIEEKQEGVEAISIHEDDKKEKEISEGLKEIALRIENLMVDQKLYLEEGLSVKEVSEKLEVQAYQVSQAINNCLGKSFFDLVNGYRVEEAKRMILDEKLNHLSMIGIGFEAGFSSKTAFNTAFKKHAGMTPSEYKKSQLGEVI
jgi:AraC-like DNA-binding protein